MIVTKKTLSYMKLVQVLLYVVLVINILILKIQRRMNNLNLEVNNLKVQFPIKGGIFGRTVDHIKAVDGVSFKVKEGMTYGLVGESGSGKSTTGKAIIGLNKVTDGEIIFNGKNITNEQGKREALRKKEKKIFQRSEERRVGKE